MLCRSGLMAMLFAIAMLECTQSAQLLSAQVPSHWWQQSSAGLSAVVACCCVLLSAAGMLCIISAQWDSLSVDATAGRASAPRSGAKASARVMIKSSNVRKRVVIVIRLVPLGTTNQDLRVA